MAWVDQQKKARIAAELKKVMPKGWRYSLAVHHHSTLCLTISAAPVDLIALNIRRPENKGAYLRLNAHHLSHEYQGDLLQVFNAINDALNLENYDNSDIQTDYFDVGHYVDIRIGRWNRPFTVLGAAPAARTAAAS